MLSESFFTKAHLKIPIKSYFTTEIFLYGFYSYESSFAMSNSMPFILKGSKNDEVCFSIYATFVDVVFPLWTEHMYATTIHPSMTITFGEIPALELSKTTKFKQNGFQLFFWYLSFLHIFPIFFLPQIGFDRRWGGVGDTSCLLFFVKSKYFSKVSEYFCIWQIQKSLKLSCGFLFIIVTNKKLLYISNLIYFQTPNFEKSYMEARFRSINPFRQPVMKFMGKPDSIVMTPFGKKHFNGCKQINYNQINITKHSIVQSTSVNYFIWKRWFPFCMQWTENKKWKQWETQKLAFFDMCKWEEVFSTWVPRYNELVWFVVSACEWVSGCGCRFKGTKHSPTWFPALNQFNVWPCILLPTCVQVLFDCFLNQNWFERKRTTS